MNTLPEAIRSFDPRHLDEGFYADPFPLYAALRRHSPVHRCPDGSFFLSRHEDLNAVYRNARAFVSD